MIIKSILINMHGTIWYPEINTILWSSSYAKGVRLQKIKCTYTHLFKQILFWICMRNPIKWTGECIKVYEVNFTPFELYPEIFEKVVSQVFVLNQVKCIHIWKARYNRNEMWSALLYWIVLSCINRNVSLIGFFYFCYATLPVGWV